MKAFLITAVFFMSYSAIAQLQQGPDNTPANSTPTSSTPTNSFQYHQPTINASYNTQTLSWSCPPSYSLSGSSFDPYCIFDGNPEARREAIVHDKDTGKTSAVGDDCGAAVNKTEKMCRGAEWAQFSTMAIQLASTVAQMKAQGNIKGACETAQKIYSMGSLGNAAVAGMCATQLSKCKRACKDEDSEPCETFEKYAKAAAGQSVESAVAYAGSSACANAVTAKCAGDDAYDNEDCTQFCLKPGRQDHPKCKLASNNCSDATYAAANVQYCTCLSNPFAANCSSFTGNTGKDPVPGSTPGVGDPNFNADSLGGSDYDFSGATGKGNPANVNSPTAGSSGFDGGGAGSYGFGANDGQGNPNEPINKDVLSGTGGGSAGGAVYGGGGYGDGSSASKGSGSGSSDPSGIDLKAFLPGGKKDPNRSPASAGYGDPTITKANGLTNFQKVTRKMNEKRPELMP